MSAAPNDERDEGAPTGRAPGEPPGRPPGARIGPMVWVPEMAVRGEDDPWAHRKGEPRYFALLWTMYLLFSALMTVFSIRSVGMPTQEQLILGGRGMSLMCALGVMPLWPMVRLSQSRAPRPFHAAFVDGVILVVPACAVILPISLLTGWGLEVSAALAAVIVVWSVVSGGIVALGHQRRTRLWRFGCMVLAWCVALAAPMASWGGTVMGWWTLESAVPARVALMSPISSVFPLTRAEGGAVMAFDVPSDTWGWIAAPLIAGALVWVWAWAVSRSGGAGGSGGDRGARPGVAADID